MKLFVSELKGIRVKQGTEGGESRMFVLQPVNGARYRMVGGSIRSITQGNSNI